MSFSPGNPLSEEELTNNGVGADVSRVLKPSTFTNVQKSLRSRWEDAIEPQKDRVCALIKHEGLFSAEVFWNRDRVESEELWNERCSALLSLVVLCGVRVFPRPVESQLSQPEYRSLHKPFRSRSRAKVTPTYQPSLERAWVSTRCTITVRVRGRANSVGKGKEQFLVNIFVQIRFCGNLDGLRAGRRVA